MYFLSLAMKGSGFEIERFNCIICLPRNMRMMSLAMTSWTGRGGSGESGSWCSSP